METTSEFQRFRSDISDLLLIIKRRWRPSAITASSLFIVIAVLAAFSKPTYEASGKLLIKKLSATSALTASGREIGELNPLGMSTDPISTEMEVIQSLPIVTKVIKDLQLTDDEGKPLEPKVFIEKKLTVEKPKFTDVLQISYESKSAEEASKVVNKIMDLYIDSGIASDRQQAVKTEIFIQRQLPNTRTMVLRAEETLRQFKQAYSISDLALEETTTNRTIADINQKITETRTLLESSQARFAVIKRQLGSGVKDAYIQNTLNYTPAVQDISKQLKNTESELAIARDRYQAQHPIIIDLEDRSAQLRSILQTEASKAVGNSVNMRLSSLQNGGVKDKLESDFVQLQAEIAAFGTQLNTLNSEKAIYEKRAYLFPTIEQKQRELQRQLDSAQSSYKLLLDKLQEARISANQGSGSAKVIEYAVTNDKQVLKPIIIKLVLGFLLSMLSGILLTIWLEIKDKSIKTLKETKELFGYPVIGIIPIFDEVKQEVSKTESEIHLLKTSGISKLSSSAIFESFRMLQSNLKFLKSDEDLKTIVVTSCVTHEGKSTVSANLAMAMAEKGFKVLLIDSDMRRPTQHHIWSVTQPLGLSEVIVGQITIDKALHKIDERLHFMSAGVTPPNPSALLDSNRMEEVIKDCKNEFDYVILDTPPLLAANETLSLSDLSDGVILVARPGVTGSNTAKVAKEVLQKLNSKILGLVINGIDMKTEPDSYFHYSNEYSNSIEVDKLKVKTLHT